MIESGFLAICVLVFLAMSIFGHKQRIEALKFEERLYKIRRQFLKAYGDLDTNDTK